MHVRFFYAKFKRILVLVSVFDSCLCNKVIGMFCVIGGSRWKVNGNLSLRLTKWFVVGWDIVKRDDCIECHCSGADESLYFGQIVHFVMRYKCHIRRTFA